MTEIYRESLPITAIAMASDFGTCKPATEEMVAEKIRRLENNLDIWTGEPLTIEQIEQLKNP